jgi:GAF domain-containing protein
MGAVDFQIALYDSSSQLVQIPYSYEGNEKIVYPAFTLGNNLISLVVRNRQPIMIIRDLADRAQEMGIKTITGNTAKSWLGAPLIVAGEAIGAIVAQDLDNEDRFGEEDLRLMTTLALQVAAVVRNARLLEESRQRVKHESLLYEITNKIRRSSSIHAVLETTARELSLALGLHKTEIAIRSEAETYWQTDEGVKSSGNGHHPADRSEVINPQVYRGGSPEVPHDA